MFPSMRRTLVCLRFPPLLDSRYTGKLFVPVRSTRYGLTAAGVVGVDVTADAVDVEALAIPRKRVTVDDLGRASGRRNASDMEGN
jgi:hypothetical protein